MTVTDLSIYGLCAESPGPFRPDIRAEMLERSHVPNNDSTFVTFYRHID